jgi:hypothetical protein
MGTGPATGPAPGRLADRGGTPLVPAHPQARDRQHDRSVAGSGGLEADGDLAAAQFPWQGCLDHGGQTGSSRVAPRGGSDGLAAGAQALHAATHRASQQCDGAILMSVARSCSADGCPPCTDGQDRQDPGAAHAGSQAALATQRPHPGDRLRAAVGFRTAGSRGDGTYRAHRTYGIACPPWET